MAQPIVINKKRLVIRLVLLALIILLGFGLYYIGKEHEILIDNKDVEIAGTSYEAAEYLVVTVNGDEENTIELYKDERDEIRVSGPKHKIKVDILDEDTEEVLKSNEMQFNFGRKNKLMISLPALAEGAPDVYLPHPSTLPD